MKWPPCIGITCVSCGASAHQGCRMNWPPPVEQDKADYQCGECGHHHGSHDAFGCLRCECKMRTLPLVPSVPKP